MSAATFPPQSGDEGKNEAARLPLASFLWGCGEQAVLGPRTKAAIYPYREFTDIGGLMAYGADPSDINRHAADQVDQIFKGRKPEEIPFYQPTKFELIINMKTAKSLGITVPLTLLIAADEVIE